VQHHEAATTVEDKEFLSVLLSVLWSLLAVNSLPLGNGLSDPDRGSLSSFSSSEVTQVLCKLICFTNWKHKIPEQWLRISSKEYASGWKLNIGQIAMPNSNYPHWVTDFQLS